MTACFFPLFSPRLAPGKSAIIYLITLIVDIWNIRKDTLMLNTVLSLI